MCISENITFLVAIFQSVRKNGNMMTAMNVLILSALLMSLSTTPVDDKATRVQRIEQGLMVPLVLNGEESPRSNLKEQMAQLAVPGLAIAVIDDYEIDWIGTYGVRENGKSEPIEKKTMFQVGSISKPVTAWLTLMVAHGGALDLDKPVTTMLHTWTPPENEFTKTSPILLRHLLTHQAGFSAGAYGLDRAATFPALLEFLQGKHKTPAVTVVSQPGKSFCYSNPAYLVLQQLLEDVSGMSLDQLARKKLFTPLGMEHSTFAEPLPEKVLQHVAAGHLKKYEKVADKAIMIPGGPGGLWSSIDDMAQFLREIMRAYQGHQNSTLPVAAAKQYFTPQILDMGLGIYVSGKGEKLRFQYTGGTVGYVAYLTGYPALGKAAVILTNGSGGSSLYPKLIGAVASEYNWPDLPVLRNFPVEKSVPSSSLVGRYRFDNAPELIMTISEMDGKVTGQLNDYPPFSPEFCLDSIWFIPTYFKEIEFHPPHDGIPAGIFYRTPGFLGNHLTKMSDNTSEK